MQGKLYCKKFEGHIYRFIQDHGLLPKSKLAWIALSGGVDSMALLHTMAKLKDRLGLTLRALSIDHRFRPESRADIEFCRKECRRLEIPFSSFSLSEKIAQNKEHSWRAKRKEIFKQALGARDALYQGHHLDDSFEWYLMGALKSSTRKILGIPVKNGQIHRPFLSVSKSQIIRYAHAKKISFREDASNHDLRFERNCVRQILDPIQKRFPKYLKHYSIRQNQLSMEEGSHVLKQKGQSSHFVDIFGAHLFWDWENLGLKRKKQALIESIWALSSQSKGSLGKEATKLAEASFRARACGPMTFSGGVLAYLDRNMVYLANKSILAERKKALGLLGQRRKTYGSLEEFKKYYAKNYSLLSLPLFIPKSSVGPSGLPKEHPLYSFFMENSSSQGLGKWTSPLRLAQSRWPTKRPLEVLEFYFLERPDRRRRTTRCIIA